MKKPSFSRSLLVSISLHLFLFLLTAITLKPQKIKPAFVQKNNVVWTQTVKQKKPTPKDKLPAPNVSRVKPKKKVEEKINIEKKKPEKKPEEKKPKKKKEEKKDRKKLLEEALAKLKKDDRPTPKDDNFDSLDSQEAPSLLTSDEADAIKASPELLAYTQTINELVVDNFLWYQSEKSLTTHVEIKLNLDGSIENVQIVESSGNSSFDQATLRSLQKSSPFPPPTGKLIPLFQQETIVFIFDGSQL